MIADTIPDGGTSHRRFHHHRCRRSGLQVTPTPPEAGRPVCSQCTATELAAGKKPITVFLSFIILTNDELGFGKKGDYKVWHIHSAVPTVIVMDGNDADKE